MRLNLSICLSLAAVMLSSCSMPQRGVEVLKVGDSDTRAIVYPSEVRGAYFLKEGSKTRFCAEPAPDVALQTLEKLTAKLTFKKGLEGEEKNAEADFSPEFEAKVIELAGRTDLLLVAREMLYRACELSANNKDIGSEEVLELYRSVTQLIGNLAESDRLNATTELNRSITERDKAAKEAADVMDK